MDILEKNFSFFVLSFLSLRTAAAVAYGLNQRGGERNVLVLDLGGGSFDVSLLTIDSGNVTVKGTNGDTHLGGEDFDQRVIQYFIQLYKEKTGKNVRKDNRAVQKLRREVERVKRVLSSQHQARIEIDSFFEGEVFSETLTRAKFEELNMVREIRNEHLGSFVISDRKFSGLDLPKKLHCCGAVARNVRVCLQTFTFKLKVKGCS